MKLIMRTWIVVMAMATTQAAAADRVERVRFKPGATSSTLTGSIRGYDGVKYMIGATAGQVMSVLFGPRNRSCYMNVTTPGADTATFIGSMRGNEYAANLSASGDYIIQLYLMRNAARRNESCRYSVTIEITGAPGGASAGVSDGVMKDRCKGEAARMYGVQPGQIDVTAVRTVSSGFEIDGTVNKGAEGIKKLRCIYNASRSLDHIMAMTPDGE